MFLYSSRLALFTGAVRSKQSGRRLFAFHVLEIPALHHIPIIVCELIVRAVEMMDLCPSLGHGYFTPLIVSTQVEYPILLYA